MKRKEDKYAWKQGSNAVYFLQSHFQLTKGVLIIFDFGADRDSG